MKRIFVLLFLIYLNSTIGNCQLLSNPSLTVEDFEIALTNADHLGKILSEHILNLILLVHQSLTQLMIIL